MDTQQQEFWNNKFEKEGFMYGEKPNMFIKYNLNGVKKNGKVLCLAEGEGRNAIFLAKEGYEVETIDNSDVGVAKLNAKAKEENLNITAHHMDLNDWEPEEGYDAIVASFMHLPEPLRTQTFKRCIEALNLNGRIIMEFFSKDQMRENFPSGGPKDLDLLYEVEMLSPIFNKDDRVELIQLSQEVDTLDEGWGHQGLASLVRLILKKTA